MNVCLCRWYVVCEMLRVFEFHEEREENVKRMNSVSTYWNIQQAYNY